MVNLNLVAQPGETEGYTPQDHLAVLHRHAPDLRVDVVLADSGTVDAASLRSACEELGASLLVADVARDDVAGQHDPEKLSRAYAAIFEGN